MLQFNNGPLMTWQLMKDICAVPLLCQRIDHRHLTG